MFKREGRDTNGYSICELKTIFFRYKKLLNHDHKHEGCDNNIVPSVTKDLANVLKEIESLIKY